MHRHTETTDRTAEPVTGPGAPDAIHELYGGPDELTSARFFEQYLGRTVASVEVTPLTADFAHSGSELSRVVVQPARTDADAVVGTGSGTTEFILKRLNPKWDWLMQVTEDTQCRSVTLWSHGIFDELPQSADTATIACARDDEGYAILMRAVEDRLVTNQHFSEAQNATFVDSLAAMHARFLEPAPAEARVAAGGGAGVGSAANEGGPAGVTSGAPAPAGRQSRLADPALGLCHIHDVFRMFSPVAAGRFAALDRDIHHRIHEGWQRVAEVMPSDVTDVIMPIVSDPQQLVDRLTQFPHTLVHGDYRHSNLGWDYGRTIMLDWQLATYGPPAIDLGRYIGANSPFLPVSKEEILANYRRRLEEHLADEWQAAARTAQGPGQREPAGYGAPTSDRAAFAGQLTDLESWWEPQLYLGLLGGFIQDGWAIALKATTWEITRDTREHWKADLAWWTEVIRRGAKYL